MNTNKKIFLSLISALILVVLAIFVRAMWLGYKKSKNPSTVMVGDAVFKVDIADSPFRRMRGLSGLENLPEDRGLLMLFDKKDTPTIWPKTLKFPIDIIWIDGETIVGVERNAIAEDNLALEGVKLYIPGQPIDKVLQINAGLSDRLKIGAGRWINININK